MYSIKTRSRGPGKIELSGFISIDNDLCAKKFETKVQRKSYDFNEHTTSSQPRCNIRNHFYGKIKGDLIIWLHYLSLDHRVGTLSFCSHEK
jgi:hypothetical protein